MLDHLHLGIVFPLSFTSHALDLSRWVLKLDIQGCTSHISGAMTLPFAISLEKDQDVILREQGTPLDGRNRKGMEHRRSLSLNRGGAAHWKCGGEPRQS